MLEIAYQVTSSASAGLRIQSSWVQKTSSVMIIVIDIALCVVQLSLAADSCEEAVSHLQTKEASTGAPRNSGKVD